MKRFKAFIAELVARARLFKTSVLNTFLNPLKGMGHSSEHNDHFPQGDR